MAVESLSFLWLLHAPSSALRHDLLLVQPHQTLLVQQSGGLTDGSGPRAHTHTHTDHLIMCFFNMDALIPMAQMKLSQPFNSGMIIKQHAVGTNQIAPATNHSASFNEDLDVSLRWANRSK